VNSEHSDAEDVEQSVQSVSKQQEFHLVQVFDYDVRDGRVLGPKKLSLLDFVDVEVQPGRHNRCRPYSIVLSIPL
tara:strand:+ start:1684 stop:1908 length:225 start_codon:yes stop_codon:yes gene_type:complete